MRVIRGPRENRHRPAIVALSRVAARPAGRAWRAWRAWSGQDDSAQLLPSMLAEAR